MPYWKYAQPDTKIVNTLAAAINVSDTVAKVLVNRGINTFEEAKSFFRPEKSQILDPYLMKDMDKAIARIDKAIENQEKIMVYGDYDVDGTTAVALAYGFLRTQYKNIEYYIPHRYAEGYGISTKSIDYAKEQGITLIIALDCGIKSVDKIAYANTLAIDYIICDHHLPGDELPAAIAILDPKRDDCAYPFKELSGCGIGFKLIQAYAIKHEIAEEIILGYLDLVCVSTACDIVPIVHENRTLAHFGLSKLNQTERPGLQVLKELSRNKNALSISDIVFQIGPRINAAGRMADAKEAVAMLLSDNKEQAHKTALSLNLNNTERKSHDQSITAEALDMLLEDKDLNSKRSNVLFAPHWHKGVIGIVASRVIEHHYKPTVVLTRTENGRIAGSARSVHGFDLYYAIDACADVLEQYGGHTFAAGLTLLEENLPLFREKFEAVVSSTITEVSLTPVIQIDEELKLKDITPKLIRLLNQCEPHGPGNMKPIFSAKNVWCKYMPTLHGSEHLKMSVQQTPDGLAIDAIGFGLGQYYNLVAKGIPFDMCFTIDENTWNGKTTIQLMIKDIKMGK